MLCLSCFCYAFVHVCLLMTWKGLTSWLSFVMSNCEVVTFPLVFWVRCGAWLYRFLIFALFLILIFVYVTDGTKVSFYVRCSFCYS